MLDSPESRDCKELRNLSCGGNGGEVSEGGVEGTSSAEGRSWYTKATSFEVMGKRARRVEAKERFAKR